MASNPALQASEHETASRIGRVSAQQGFVYALGFAAQRGIRIALLPIYAHWIGAAGYGLLQLFATYVQFLVALLLHGQGAALVRLGFEAESDEERGRLRSTVVWHLLATSAAAAALLALGGRFLSEWLAWGVPFWPFGALLVGQCVCTVFVSLYDQHLAALQRAADAMWLSLGRTLLMVGLVLALVVGLDLGVLGKLVADAVAALLGACIALRALAPGSPRARSRSWRRRALGYGLPLLPHGLAGLVNNLIDRVMVHAFLGLAAVGVYALAYQLISLGLFLLTGSNRSFAPSFVETAREAERLRATGDGAAADALLAGLSLACLRFFCGGLLVFAALTALLEPLVFLLASEEFSEAWKIGPLLGAGMMATALYYALNQSMVFTAQGARRLPLVTGAAALVNVAANAWLLPRYGIQGAALATLVSNLVLPLGSALGGRHVLPLPHRTGRWVTAGSAALAYLAAVAWIDRGANASPLSLAAKLGIGIGLSFVLARVAEVSPWAWLRARAQQIRSA